MQLRVRTDHSLNKSTITIDDLIEYSKINNLDYAAICELNNLDSSIEFLLKCKKNEIKPIVGIEIQNENVNILVFAQNFDGLINLYRMYNNNFNFIDHINNNNIVIILNNEVNIPNISNENIYYSNSKYTNDRLVDTSIINIIERNDLLEKYFKKIFSDVDFNSMDKHQVSKNNISIAKRISINIPDKFWSIPQFNTNELNISFEQDQIYKKRLEKELDAIISNNFSDYFILNKKITDIIKNNNLGEFFIRGSAGASLLLYLLDITKLDPIKYNLPFERFLNVERLTMPDIDIDVSASNREKIIKYISDEFGNSNVAKFIVCNRYKNQNILKDILISENILTNKVDINDLDESYNKYIDVSKNISNIIYSKTTHVSGIIISKTNIIDSLPCRFSKDTLIIQIDKDSLESIGLPKLDILSSMQIDKLHELEEMTNKKISDIDFNDQKVFKFISNANTQNVFHISNKVSTEIISKIKPKNLFDISQVIALNRPGPINDSNIYISNRIKNIKSTFRTKEINDILDETSGVFLFQEQVMEFFIKIADFSLERADIVRYAISKKDSQKIKDFHRILIEHAESKLMDIFEIEEIYKKIKRFTGYGLNKSHAFNYSYIIFIEMYYKTYFTDEYNLLLFKKSKISKSDFFKLIKYTSKKVILPSVNSLIEETNIANNKIILGFNTIDFIEINKLRRISINKYDNIEEFVKMNEDLSPEEIIKLAKIGFFQDLNIKLEFIEENIDIILNKKNIFLSNLNYNNLKLKYTTIEKIIFQYNIYGYTTYKGNIIKVIKRDNDNNFIIDDGISKNRLVAIIKKNINIGDTLKWNEIGVFWKNDNPILYI